MRTTKSHDAALALDSAMRAIFLAWNSGYWLSIERGNVHCLASPFVVPKPAPIAINLSQPAIKDILVATRKDWAEDLNEFAIAPVVANSGVTSCGVVLLERRRILGPGVLVTDPTKIPDRFKACNGIILHRGISNKEAIAWWLWQAGMLRSDVSIIEVPDDPGADFRDLISGSHWMKSKERPADHEPIAKALQTAMEARSYRKEAIQVRRTNWWQALAAASLARRLEISGEEACRRMDLEWSNLSRWIEKSLAFKPRTFTKPAQTTSMDAPQDFEVAGEPMPTSTSPMIGEDPSSFSDHPATEKQRKLVQSLTIDHPELQPLFTNERWVTDRRLASTLIGKALTAVNRIKKAEEACRTEVSAAIAEALAT